MKKFLKVIGILFAILIALMVLIVVMSDGDSTKTNKATSTEQTTTPVEPPVVIDARTLATDYEDNEVAADQKYKDKTLEVSGKIAGIDSSIGDNAVVKLVGKNEFQTVDAKGDDSFTQYAGTLKKGQKITIICEGDGEIIGSPQLSDCKAK